MFQAILGVIVILAGIALGLWLGIWVCFVGGIVDVITSFEGVDFSNFSLSDFAVLQFAWGIAKVICASFVGWVSFMICTVLGGGLIATSKV